MRVTTIKQSGVIMNYYIKLGIFLGLHSLHILATNKYITEITKLETTALKKLTSQMQFHEKADIAPEINRLDQITVEQSEKNVDSLKIKTGMFGAATLGALLIQSTKNGLPQTRSALGDLADIAIKESEDQAKKIITGFEIPAALSMLPSLQTCIYGLAAIGGIFALYKIDKAIHASCRAKFTIAEHNWARQLELVRTDTQLKQEELRKTLAILQEHHTHLETYLTGVQTGIYAVINNQRIESDKIARLGNTISELQTNLGVMSKQAHWDLEQHKKRAQTAQDLKEHQEVLESNREIDLMIKSIEQDIQTEELSSARGARARPPIWQPQSVADIKAGVGPIRKTTLRRYSGNSVDEDGCFGCFGYASAFKKPAELR